jgi:tetratricopeptide (TPR) repeat protein
MNRILPIPFLLLTILPLAVSESASPAEEDPLVPMLNARSTTQGTFRFGNETLEPMFGGSREQRVARDHAAGVETLELEAKGTVLTVPRAETTRERSWRRASPRSAAALRIADKGRTLMKAGDYESALLAFEKSLALDPNPHLYYDLAHAHHHLGQYRESSNFVDAAQPWLIDYPESISALAKIRSENGRALARQAAERRAVREQNSPGKPEARSPNGAGARLGSLFAVILGVVLLCFLTSAVRKNRSELRLATASFFAAWRRVSQSLQMFLTH